MEILNSQQNQEKKETVEVPASHLKKNLYPAIRHTLLVILVLLTLAAILFLMHQNGKSIYDHGI